MRTRDNRLIFNVAINYGGRAEIADAARRLAREAAAGALRPEDVDEEAVARRLYVPELPDVDLLIRTSGEMRLSTFMLWQVSYAEIVTLGVLWPDFRKRHLHEAIARYQKRQRRSGAVSMAKDSKLAARSVTALVALAVFMTLIRRRACVCWLRCSWAP